MGENVVFNGKWGNSMNWKWVEMYCCIGNGALIVWEGNGAMYGKKMGGKMSLIGNGLCTLSNGWKYEFDRKWGNSMGELLKKY